MKPLTKFLLSLDGILVHRRVTLSIKFAGTHSSTWVERGVVRVKCLAQEQTNVPGQGSNSDRSIRSRASSRWTSLRKTACPGNTRRLTKSLLCTSFLAALNVRLAGKRAFWWKSRKTSLLWNPDFKCRLRIRLFHRSLVQRTSAMWSILLSTVDNRLRLVNFTIVLWSTAPTEHEMNHFSKTNDVVVIGQNGVYLSWTGRDRQTGEYKSQSQNFAC